MFVVANLGSIESLSLIYPVVLEELGREDFKSLMIYGPTNRNIRKAMARCITKGLREHSLKIQLNPFRSLGGDLLTNLHNKNKMDVSH